MSRLLLSGIGFLLTAPATPEKPPVKVFILVGQSNMEGQAVADLDGADYNQGRGTLESMMRDPAKAPLVKNLKDEPGEGGSFATMFGYDTSPRIIL